MLHCKVWVPNDCNPHTILHVIHGMTEHMGRYTELAEHLTSQGIAVAGFDLRGHGLNAGSTRCASFCSGDTGDCSGWQTTLDDIERFSYLLREQFPDAKYFMLGFSLGSFLLRDYLNQYPCEHLSGAIVMGTGDQPGLVLDIMKSIVKNESKRAGSGNTTDLIQKLSFGVYNSKFAPNKSRADWLTSDGSACADYISDSLCRPSISADLFYDLLSSMKRTGKVKNINKNGKLNNFPILLMAGACDPVGDMSKGVERVRQKLMKAGLKAVMYRIYPSGRHDILHEKTEIREDATNDILCFLTSEYCSSHE